jgi:hypothetical protein
MIYSGKIFPERTTPRPTISGNAAVMDKHENQQCRRLAIAKCASVRRLIVVRLQH